MIIAIIVLVIIVVLVILAAIDLEKRIIPNRIVVPAGIANGEIDGQGGLTITVALVAAGAPRRDRRARR